MCVIKLGEQERHLADIIWNNEPISSSEIAKLANESMSWKKTTSYTVLKRLCDKGVFANSSGIVTSIISKKQYYNYKTQQIIDDAFNGSFPGFLSAFLSGKKLTEEETKELLEIVEKMEQ